MELWWHIPRCYRPALTAALFSIVKIGLLARALPSCIRSARLAIHQARLVTLYLHAAPVIDPLVCCSNRGLLAQNLAVLADTATILMLDDVIALNNLGPFLPGAIATGF
jgi:hypothetical protein